MHALIGQLLSEATLLGYIAQLHRALAQWERHAIERLLLAPAMHVDETSLRVDRNNHWIHVYSAGALTVKRLHPKRGREAIEAIGIIPRYAGVAGTVAQTDQVLDVHHRPGNVHDSNGADAFIERCVRTVREALPGVKIEVRIDSAFFNQGIVERLHSLGVTFSVSVPFERFA